MTTDQQLEEVFSNPLSKQEVEDLARAYVGQVETLHRLSFDLDKAKAFRAAWVLESIAAHYPQWFTPYANTFLATLKTQKNPSCQRHFTKILMFMTARNASVLYRQALADADRERIVETVFEWLIHPDTPVAVAVNCLDILVYFIKEFDWISEELEHQILMRINQGSPAMDSRGKRILKKLRSRARSK